MAGWQVSTAKSLNLCFSFRFTFITYVFCVPTFIVFFIGTMDNAHAYDAHADTINVDDIASDSRNRIILRRLQRNNADEHNLIIQNENERDEDDVAKIVLTIVQRGLMIWGGWDTLLVKMNIWRSW